MPDPQFKLLACRRPGIEAMRADSAHVFGRHTHDQFGIGVITRGAHRSASGRGVVEAGAGDLITVNPGEVHDGRPVGDGGRAWRMLYLDPGVVEALARDIVADAGRLVPLAEFEQPAWRDPRQARLFDTAFRALTSEDGSADDGAADEALLGLLAGLLHPQLREPRGVSRGIVRARAWMDDTPESPLTLEALAAEAGMSRYQFLRGFSRATGLTPHAYLMQRRVHAARRRLRAGWALADAAAASGFCDQGHMTRLFTRTFGISPGSYARALRDRR